MPQVDFIRGHDANLYYQLNGTFYAVAHATDTVLKLTRDIQETTTKNTLQGKTFDFTGKYTYTLTLKGITNLLDVPNIAVLQSLILTGTKVQFAFTDEENIQYSGVVLLTSSDLDSPYAGLSQNNFEMTGDGELGITTTDVPPIPLPGANVTIIDQFGNTVAIIPAPGNYAVIRFDTIDCGHADKPSDDLIIIAGE